MTTTDLHHHDHHDADAKVIFGFWIYILSDCVLFAVLFTCYVVLQHHLFGGVGIRQVSSLNYVLIQSLFILTASFAYGIASSACYRGQKGQVIAWLAIMLVLGLIFVLMGLHEFTYLINLGHTWQKSAFLSSFFTLIAIHALHVISALLWIVILMIQFAKENVTNTMRTRLTCLGLFWNFLNIVWICIVTIVYLMGAI